MSETIEAPPVITTALAEYQPTAAALAELRQRFGNVAFDLTTTNGERDARSARLELVKLRTSLEAKRVELKAPALERSRLIDAEAKRITAAILDLETPIDEQIRVAEKRKEAERQAAIEAERHRIAALRERIEQIAAVARRAVGKPAAEIEAKIKLVVAIQIGDDFDSLKAEAERVHADTLTALRELLSAAQAHEAEAARLAAERVELDRQRAEREAAERAERERAEAEQRAVDSINAWADALQGLRTSDEVAAAIVLAERELFEGRTSNERVAAVIAAARRSAHLFHGAALQREKLARDAAAQREREQAERDRQAEEQRRIDAQQAEQRAAQARIDAERAQLDAEQAERDAAETARKAAEAAAEAQAAEEARQAQERAAGAAAEAKSPVSETKPAADETTTDTCETAEDALRRMARELIDARSALREALGMVERLSKRRADHAGVLVRIAELRALGGLA